jgi:hypothetical protein
MIQLAKLKPNKRNPRKIADAAMVKLCESIERDPEFMVLRPIVVDEKMNILGGNQRYAACQNLGMKTVPGSWVKIASGLTPGQRKRFVLVDNAPEGMAGDWDLELLTADWEMPELGELGFDLDIMVPPETEPFGDTSTDRDGQGVASTWDSCRKTGVAPVRIGPWETRLPIALAERVVSDCTSHYEKNGKPMHERFVEIITCGLQS